ncbi:hypothetical protein N7490_003694 [Penicillium lividum]|nr:hypothetical protein N7490_003694 [Penicillium lividum]
MPHAQRDLKRLILTSARSQSKCTDYFDDFTKGKGHVIIMLLRDPPGVGKTLTAKSVAEVMKKLTDALEIAPKWGGVLLINEADVFMKARDSKDLERNESVFIFLRNLEHYQIKNLIHTANLLAEDEECQLNIEHIQAVLNLIDPKR